jgi:hypothetical protein
MAGMEEIRLEVLKGLTILAIYDDQFRRGVMSDLEGTLSRYGFALNDYEMERLRSGREGVADMSDEELVRVLTAEEEALLAPEQQEIHIYRRWGRPHPPPHPPPEGHAPRPPEVR